MLPGSLRRVASTAPLSPMLAVPVPRAALAHITLTCTSIYQTRYSSSKPSRDNDSGDLPVDESVQPAAVSKTSETKSSGDKRKRKAKDGPEKQKLPRVPSTKSIPNESLALSSFFSLHRPISVTHSLPRIVTDDAFSAIFAHQAEESKPSKVISTISRSIHGLEQPMANLSIENEVGAAHEADIGVQKIDLSRRGGTGAAVSVQINSMSGNFLPFRPPPLPQPQPQPQLPKSTSEAATMNRQGDVMAADGGQQQQTRVYKAIFTIEESTDAHGGVKILAHSPELIEESGSDAEPEPRSFLERMALRQLRYEDARDQQDKARVNSILAISVKRQRKLKMKKKKYKKLQKRLRNERRKHDR